MTFTLASEIMNLSERMKDQNKTAALADLRQRRIVSLQRQIDLQKEIGALNSQLAAIVESSDDAIIGKDLNGIITSWNRGAEQIYGYTAEEAIGQPVSLLVPAGHIQEIPSILEKIARGEKLDHFETVRVTKDGRQINISLTTSPIRDSSGAIIGASTISRDITVRREYEDTIQRQARVLDQIQESVITTDFEGRVIGWNRGAERMFLYSAKEAEGQHISFIYPEDQREFLEREIIVPLKEKGFHESEVRLRRKSGEEFHALLLLTMLKNAKGIVTGMIGSSVDITARKETEDRIRREKELWEQTFDAIPDIVAVIDGQHIIQRANRALSTRLDIGRDELIGKRCFSAICGMEKPSALCPGSMAIISGREQIEERYIEQLQGHYRISCTPVFSCACNGSTACFVEVCRDISGQKEMENKLLEAANTDVLTGLYNRRGFITLAEHQLRVADRENKNLVLVYVDLNDMKGINDRFGHIEGDRALADMARLLRDTFRESDILGRLGGDEFAVLLTEPSEQDIEQIINAHLQENLKSHNEQSGRPYTLSVSVGMATYHPANACTLDDLLSAADKLMYLKKPQRMREERDSDIA